MSEQNVNNGNGSKIGLIIALILALVLGGLYFKEMGENKVKKQEIAALETEKSAMQSEIEAKIAALNDLQAKYDANDSTLMATKEELEATLKKLKSTNWDVTKLRRERNKLRAQLDKFQGVIDSISAANLALQGANDSLSKGWTATTNELGSLQTTFDNNMSIAKRIVAAAIVGEGQRKKPNGKIQTTDKAKKVNRIHVEFTLAENQLAESGMTDVFLRVLGPDQKVLSIENKGSGKLRLVGVPEEVEYSTSKKVNYTNSTMKVSMDWEQNTPFAAGRYKAEVYGKGYKMGYTEFSLR